MTMISIVMPVFNGTNYVTRAVQSVQAQTFQDWELVIVDDGSTDGTDEIVADIAAQDARVLLIEQANAGQFVARHAGIKASSGELITFMDVDDWVAPNWLATIVPLMTSVDAVQIGHTVTDTADVLPAASGQTMILHQADIMPTWLADKLLDGFLWSKTFHRATLLATLAEVQRPEYDFLEDVWLIHHLMPKLRNICLVNAPLYAYYQREDSTINGHVPLAKKRYGYLLNKQITEAWLGESNTRAVSLVRRQRTLMKYLSSLTRAEIKAEYSFLMREVHELKSGEFLAKADRFIWQLMGTGRLGLAQACRNGLLAVKQRVRN